MLTEEAAMSDPSPAPDTTADAETESTGHDVPMRSVEDMEDEDGEEEDGEEEREDDDADDGAMAADPSSTFIPPRLPSTLRVTRDSSGVHVRLTLSVSAAGSQLPPGLEIDDCGQCPFCLDKPKYGGPGTKRQKCELKQQEAVHAYDSRNPRIWCSLHLISQAEMEEIRQISQLPLPEPLVNAIDQGPLPLVWAYKRKRRARTLPPAYVLMYYCEGRVPLDRTQLATSRQRYYKNSRGNEQTARSGPPVRRRGRRAPRRATPHAYPLQVAGDEAAGWSAEASGAMVSAHSGPQPVVPLLPASMGEPGGMTSWPPMPAPGACPIVYGQCVAPQMYPAGPSYVSDVGAQQATSQYGSQPYSAQPVVYGALRRKQVIRSRQTWERMWILISSPLTKPPSDRAAHTIRRQIQLTTTSSPPCRQCRASHHRT